MVSGKKYNNKNQKPSTVKAPNARGFFYLADHDYKVAQVNLKKFDKIRYKMKI